MAAGTSDFPTSLDTTTNLPAASTLATAELDGDGNANVQHSNLHGVADTALVQIETKLGTGSGAPTAAGKLLRATSASASGWSTLTFPDTAAISTIIYASAADTLAALATANNGILVTSGTGVPSISSTTPALTLGGTLTLNGQSLSGIATGSWVARWSGGTAATAAQYEITRDADATNQLHFNVPTGASFEWSVNDVAEMTLSATAVNFQNNSITTTGGGSLTGTWSDLGTVTTVDINGGTQDGVTIGGASAAAATVTTLTANTSISTYAVGGSLVTLGPNTGPNSSLNAQVNIRAGQAGGDATLLFTKDNVANKFHLAYYGVGGYMVLGGNTAVGTSPLLTVTAAGLFAINDTANANMTTGLTIQQGAADNEAQAWKSSDVAHPMTDMTEADTYAFITKYEAVAGGLQIQGYKSAAGTADGAIHLMANLGEAADTTDTSASYGVLRATGRVTNGAAGVTAVAATGNVLTIDNNGTTSVLVKGNGDLHVTNTTLTALDDYPDALLMRAGRAAMAPVGSPLHDDFQHLIAEYAPVLEEHRIMFFERDGEGRITGAMNNVMASVMLSWDAHYQTYRRIEQLEAEIAELRRALPAGR